MPSSFLEFVKKQWDFIFVGCVFLAVIYASFVTLTTTPQLWTDEAISIHIARSFSTHGILSIQTAPDTFFESPYLIQATGYPVTVPLAGFFKLFGYGVSQARIYMLLWLAAALLLVFFLARKLFSKFEAISTLLLTSTFASFHANGRTVTGEIPGFVFLLAGFYFLLLREQYALAGLLWGFAVVAKPSVFTAIIPTVFIALLLERLPFRDFIKKLFAIALGMVPAALAWIFLVLEKPFESEVWRNIVSFYKNPYGEDVTQNILHNLSSFFDSTTLIYFSGLFALVLIAWVLSFKQKDKLTFLYSFIIIYSLFAFFYYVRSSGYLRYILIAELLILFILPHALRILVSWASEYFKIQKISVMTTVAPLVGALVLIQGVHLFTAADISASDSAAKTASYINTEFPEQSLGLLNAPILGLFTDPSRTFLSVLLLGLEPIGENPLFLEEPPDVIVSYPSNRFIDEGRSILEKHYVFYETKGEYVIFKKT